MMVLVHSLYQLIQSWTILASGHTFFLNKCMQTQVSMGTGFQNIVTVFDCFHMHQSWRIVTICAMVKTWHRGLHGLWSSHIGNPFDGYKSHELVKSLFWESNPSPDHGTCQAMIHWWFGDLVALNCGIPQVVIMTAGRSEGIQTTKSNNQLIPSP